MQIFLIGMPASGKTTLGGQLAERLGFTFIDMDSEVERLTGLSVTDIFESKGENFFRLKEKEVLERLLGKEETVIATGGGTPAYFDNLGKILEVGLSIYLEVSVDALATRLEAENKERPLFKEKDLTITIEKMLRTRQEFYSQAEITVTSDDITAEHLFRLIPLHQK